MTGVCNTVGLIPAIIGGGLGNMMGMCGLGVDNMLSATVITASGEKINVSKDENSELWWGLRGAGGNFGVVSSLTVKSYEQVNGGIFCSGSIGFVGKSVNEIGEIARTLEKFEIGRKMAVGILWARIPPSFQPTFFIHLFYAGPEDEATKAFEPLFALKPTFVNDPAGVKGGRRPTWGIGLKRFDGARIQEAWKIWENFTGECKGAMASLVIGDCYNHDEANEVDEGDTAYPWRKVGVHLLFSGNYQDPSLDEEVSVVGRKFRDSLKVEGESSSVYVNFAHGDEKLEEIYGNKERIERLGKLKKKWDPERRFGFTFPIPLPVID
ncbi:hypothetical protein HYALB_00013245 [Hymenoscyphus albidus]|uniref:Berberine/berberine-like domain-containing protein n=1 Tax=Hymenoscyphus albidus TaxID=595503 RepID=A0A9N9LTT3_9HELO|nr:hypothetical protein HYALB_00013245 [Hymenoscyphus albidus]